MKSDKKKDKNMEMNNAEDVTVQMVPQFPVSIPEHRINVGVSSIIGARKNQQDSVFGQSDGDRAFGVVCDGMGGMNGGERASQTAIRILVEDYYKKMPNYDIPQFFLEEADIMNSSVRELKNEEGKPLGGGTTVVAVMINQDELYWLSVGDSRIYIIRDGQILPMNEEHNYKMQLNQMLKAGQISQEKYNSELSQSEALISYIGIEELKLIEVNRKAFRLLDQDVIVLCSDGLYQCLSEKEIAELIYYEEPDMERAAHRLTEIVEKRRIRSQDNTSIVVMQYTKS